MQYSMDCRQPRERLLECKVISPLGDYIRKLREENPIRLIIQTDATNHNLTPTPTTGNVAEAVINNVAQISPPSTRRQHGTGWREGGEMQALGSMDPGQMAAAGCWLPATTSRTLQHREGRERGSALFDYL